MVHGTKAFSGSTFNFYTYSVDLIMERPVQTPKKESVKIIG